MERNVGKLTAKKRLLLSLYLRKLGDLWFSKDRPLSDS